MKHTIFKTLVILSVLVLVSSCAGAKRKSGEDLDGEIQGQVIHEPSVNSETLPGDVYGPTAPQGPAETQVPVGSAGSETVTAPKIEPKLCLILGPGMAKAIAHAAVLEAISKAKIPVHCVVGSETGAVVGAMYSLAKGNTNSLQWQLFKLNKDNYFNFPVLSLREPKSTGKKLNDYFLTLFKNKKIEDLPIKFGTALQEEGADNTLIVDRGQLADAVSGAVAIPEIFEPWKIQGKKYYSGALANPVPIDIAKSLGGNFFVLVNVLEEPSTQESRFQKSFTAVRNLLRQQKRDASFVIPVGLGAVGFDDFGRQGEILAAGQRAAEETIADLKTAWEKWVASQQE
jgi:predicted acylesterase/phospholipase RssA